MRKTSKGLLDLINKEGKFKYTYDRITMDDIKEFARKLQENAEKEERAYRRVTAIQRYSQGAKAIVRGLRKRVNRIYNYLVRALNPKREIQAIPPEEKEYSSTMSYMSPQVRLRKRKGRS